MASDHNDSQFVHVPSLDPPVRGYLHVPESASTDGLVLTHGAGANCQSALLVGLASALYNANVTVLRCDLSFRQERPHGPPNRSAERDQQGLKRAVEWIRERVSGRVFLGGHSYGGRQASMLAASEPSLVEGLLLLSYPLHPPKRPDQLRTAHFPDLRTPALFVSGTRDGFGTVEELMSAISLIPARTRLFTVEGVGHELLRKRGGEDLLHDIAKSFAAMYK